jgi:hypothetical protein
MLESILSSSCQQPYLYEIFKHFCGMPFEIEDEFAEKNSVHPSNLCYFTVPEHFIGQTFGELYYNFVSIENVIPIGLYRISSDYDTHRFVVTNPVHSLILRGSDLVYCLAPPSEDIYHSK